jgi:hypothetical protein
MATPLKQRVSEAVASLRGYEFGKPAADVAGLERLVAEGYGNPELARQLRQELAGILRSDATLAAKQAACKQLWILGPGEALPAILGLWDAKDPRLAEAAFLAVARTPSPEFDLALRNALTRLQGRPLVAAIDLIGDRCDQDASSILARTSTHSDPSVALAAKVALEKLAWAKQGLAANDGFVPLFDGRTLDGWDIDTPDVWTARNGVLRGSTPGLNYNDFLRTKRSFGDFTLRVKMRLLGGVGNSGVQFRSKPVPNSHELEGYQADAAQNLWGTLYDESRRKKTLTDPGQDFHDRFDLDAWHEYEITAQAGQILLKLDGVVTVDYREPDPGIPRTGIIALQVHADRRPVEAWFRDIRIRENT